MLYIFFRRKCTLGTWAIFRENMVTKYILGFQKVASQVQKIGVCQQIRKNLDHMGISQRSNTKNYQIFYPRIPII